MRSLQLGWKTTTARRHLDRLVGQIGQLLVKEEVDEGHAIVELLRRQVAALRNIVPIFEASPAACGRCVLRIVNRIALKRRLVTVTGRLCYGEILAKTVSRRFLYASRPLRWAWRIATSSTGRWKKR